MADQKQLLTFLLFLSLFDYFVIFLERRIDLTRTVRLDVEVRRLATEARKLKLGGTKLFLFNFALVFSGAADAIDFDIRLLFLNLFPS